jgi:hypothetical protein
LGIHKGIKCQEIISWIREVMMDIWFDAQGGSSAPPAFVLTFDPEGMSLQCIGDMVSLSVQAHLRRQPSFWGKEPFLGFSPVLVVFHGVLYGKPFFQGNQGLGASLAPLPEFPLAILNDESALLNLSFHCTRAYLERVEEQRATNPGMALQLGAAFWAVMSVVPATKANQGASQNQGGMIHLQSRQGSDINISRSHWTDMLSAIGYPQRRTIELPVLVPQEGVEVLQEAIKHVNEAHTLFAQERYREAVQRCRQARDSLVSEPRPTWARRFLAPIIGDEKAAMIDEGLRALNRMGNAASHGTPPSEPQPEIDRDVASYVIASMTLTLDYISRKLK